MPTAYTQNLMEKGESFRTFALRCARAFGACIEMRDDDIDAPIPEKFTPSEYEQKNLAAAEAKFTALSSIKTLEAQRAYGAKEKRASRGHYLKYLDSELTQNRRLREMRATVATWKAPTVEHEGLQKFMTEQIDLCIHDTGYILDQLRDIRAQKPIEFYKRDLAAAAADLERSKVSIKADEKRTADRTAWVQQLRASLPP